MSYLKYLLPLFMALILTACAIQKGSLMVQESIVLDHNIDYVWDTIGHFDGLHYWHPAVKDTISKSNMQRVLLLNGGGEIVEDLIKYKDNKSYTYKILSSPLPVQNYVSTLSVKSIANGKTQVIWESHFDAGEGVLDSKATEVIRGVYRAGLDNLK